MNTIYKILFISLSAFLILSCEDQIDVDSGFEGPRLVVDAWITNEAGTQTITITESQDFFDNRLPTPITDATVVVSSGITDFIFESQNNGDYTYQVPADYLLGNDGDEFTLTVVNGNDEYQATTSLQNTAPIDSIRIYEEDEAFGAEDGLYSELYARDLPGKGNTYWVKSFRNDTLLNRPQELNVVYDATFDSGNDIDGIYFIRPLRFAINALDDDGVPRALNIGDKVTCEVHSISLEAFRFLKIVQEQTTNGDNTIFALPIANAVSNVVNTATGERALGFFNVAEVSRMSRVVE